MLKNQSRKAGLLLAVLLMAPASPPLLTNAHAADVLFGGSVLSTCVLTVGVPGVMATSADSKTMSSKIAGGNRGTVVAVATGSTFSISTTAPTSFAVAPGDGGSNVDFTAEYEGTGATNSGVKSGGTATPLAAGVSTVGVDLAATKTTGVYEAGIYSAAVTVTCE